MDFSAIKTLIQQNIKTNASEDITGAVLQNILLGIINTLGDDAINDIISDLNDEITNRQNAVQGEANARIEAINVVTQKINDEVQARKDEIDSLELTDSTGSAVQNDRLKVSLNVNVGSEEEPETETITELTLQSVTSQKAGLMSVQLYNKLVNLVNGGYLFGGIALPSQNPGTPQTSVFYFASGAGTYTHFKNSDNDPIVIANDGLYVFTYDNVENQYWEYNQIYNPPIGYYECDTAGGTAAKVVAAAGYQLPVSGGSIKIKMINRNTVNNAMLNINSTGAKPLFYNGSRANSGNTWDNNEVIEVYYDGTNYQAHNVEGNSGDGVFDVSVYNASGDPLTPAVYEDLAAALGTNGVNIPASKRKGGMSIKFIQSSANKYVQFRYMGTNVTTAATFTNVANWQGVDSEINNLYYNLPTSRAVFNFLEDRTSYTDLLYTELKTGYWVDNSNVEHTAASFNLYYFDNIVEGQTLWLYTANNAAYLLFVDENGNIVGTPYSSGKNYSIWKDIVVPTGAKRLKVSNLNNLTTYPNGYPLRVLAKTNNDRVSDVVNNIPSLNEEVAVLEADVKDIVGEDTINNYDNDDLSDLVFSSGKYKVVSGFNTLIVPVKNGYSVVWNYTSTAEDPLLSVYIDANEPVLNGTRDVLYNPDAGVPYTNSTGATVWLVVTFKTSTSPTITATVELKKISKYGLDIITNKWIGKKMLCIGDSITDMGLYVDPLTSLLGTITYNRGYSGECLTDGVPGETHSTSGRVDLPASDGTGHHGGFPTEADLVTILTSANDWYHMDDIPLGEVTDAPSKTASFCSAFHYLMQGLKSKYPTARIVVIIPYRIYSTRFVPASEIAFNTANDEASGFTFIKKRTEQITLDDLRDRMIKIASVYGADVIDLREVGFSFFWNYDREAYSYITDGVHDGLHPNIQGGKIMADYIAKHLISCN